MFSMRIVGRERYSAQHDSPIRVSVGTGRARTREGTTTRSCVDRKINVNSLSSRLRAGHYFLFPFSVAYDVRAF